MNKVLIHADNLALIRGNYRLFKSLNFTLNSGQAIHLQGRNGSGKTSLFKVLTGSLAPTAGVVTVFDKSPKDLEPEDYQNVLYLGHQTAIKHNLTVVENLTLNVELFDQLPVTAQVLQQALETVDLWVFRDQFAATLSAGQKRRLALARLWAGLAPDKTDKLLWLLDEPFTALDVDFIEVLQAQITKHLDMGGGVIFTSHQPLTLGSDVVVLDLGDFR